MDMKQLTTFITLTKTLNYQKAGDQLQYAPSTLFKHIRLLEQELGTALFVKAGRQLRLTPSGEAFIEHAEEILGCYRRALRTLSGGESYENCLNIGGCEINIAHSLQEFFTQFSARHPDAHMSMHTSPNAHVPAMIRDDMVDVGFYYSLNNVGIPGLRTIRMYREPVYLVASSDHPLARREKITYEDLRGVRFVYPHDSCCFVVELFARLKARGVQLGRAAFPGSMYLVAEQIKNKHAVTLMPHAAAQRFCRENGAVVLDIDEQPIVAWEMMLCKDDAEIGALAERMIRDSGEYAMRQTAADCRYSVS